MDFNPRRLHYLCFILFFCHCSYFGQSQNAHKYKEKSLQSDFSIICLLKNSFPVFPLLSTVLNCCEGDVLLLLDSSGSIANYEFSRLLLFAAELLRPFSLGLGHVRVALLQVGTTPDLRFGLDVHHDQESLKKALQSVTHLQGDTNTVAALGVAQRLLTETQNNVPKVVVWLTDGLQPGDVDAPMAELKAQGVSVLIVSAVHGDYRVLQRVATPPLESHLYFVDMDDVDIITEDLREAIISMCVHGCGSAQQLQGYPGSHSVSPFYPRCSEQSWIGSV